MTLRPALPFADAPSLWRSASRGSIGDGRTRVEDRSMRIEDRGPRREDGVLDVPVERVVLVLVAVEDLHPAVAVLHHAEVLDVVVLALEIEIEAADDGCSSGNRHPLSAFGRTRTFVHDRESGLRDVGVVEVHAEPVV